MKFEIELYETHEGKRVVELELDRIEEQTPILFSQLQAGLDKLRSRQNHRMPLCRPLGNGMFELRVGDRDTARALWFFFHGRRIIVVHCFIKKSQKTPKAAIDMATKRMAEYIERRGTSKR